MPSPLRFILHDFVPRLEWIPVPNQIVTRTNEDGSVDIHMDAGSPSDWYALLRSSIDNLRGLLEQVATENLIPDDMQVFDWAWDMVEDVDTICEDFDHEIDNQETESDCKFFYEGKHDDDIGGGDSVQDEEGSGE